MKSKSAQSKNETFSSFNESFYKRFPDLSVFDCGEINLLKVVLDGLRVRYAEKGRVSVFSFYSKFYFRIFLFLKFFFQKNRYSHRITKVELKESTYNEILIIDNGRTLTDDNGVRHSIYFDNIIKNINQKSTIIYECSLNGKPGISFEKIINTFLFDRINEKEDKFRIELKTKLKQFKKMSLFNSVEFKSVEIALHLFFINYLVWSRFLSRFKKLKVSYFTCHYHKEAQLLALRNFGIKTIELQHGLIAKQDVFYLFPENIVQVRDRAMFPDKMLTYGEYWKNLFLTTGYEFAPQKIGVIGYYLFSGVGFFSKSLYNLKQNIKNQDVLLVTTQPGLSDEMIGYLNWLLNFHVNEHNFFVLIKPHPREEKLKYKLAFENSKNVDVTDLPIDVLMSVSNMHLSIYSTCLFDALRFNIFNFCLNVSKAADYVKEISDAGVAKKIEIDESPINKKEMRNFDSDYFFAKTDYTRLRNYLLQVFLFLSVFI